MTWRKAGGNNVGQGARRKAERLPVRAMAGTAASLLALVTGAGLAFAPSAPVQAKSLEEFMVGSWEGGAYADDQSGAFTHCSMDIDRNNRGILFVYINSDFTWWFGFSGPSWKLTTGKSMSVSLRIDNGQTLQATGSVDDTALVSVPMPTDKALIDAFRTGKSMSVSVGGMPLVLDLSGSGAALDRLDNCVNQYRNVKAAGPSGPSAPSGPRPGSIAGAFGSGGATGPAPTAPSGPRTATNLPPPPPSTGSKLQTVATGTGFIVTADGTIVTNNHVVDDCKQVTVSFPGQAALPAQQLVHDKAKDFAILKASMTVPVASVARVKGDAEVAAGEHIAVYGFPLSDALSSSGNIVEGNVSSLAGLADDKTRYQISAPVQPGNSGGPLLDFTAAVVGVVNARLDDTRTLRAVGALPQNVNFAIKSTELAKFLDAHKVAYLKATPPTGQPMDLVAVAAAAQKFTLLIACQN